ncbi:hypothetical protein [Okeania sp. SIO2B3]|uniref:hypothetical protein n=1 Tax=Okeania sp. SIO2B3 TaxID=2607784 RepID=UPI0013C0956B|nr:hypothetical protein [Okeania sp. SIO2B3]NET46640.1 hypothetical protein [Okeania sp. SIO2B3]
MIESLQHKEIKCIEIVNTPLIKKVSDLSVAFLDGREHKIQYIHLTVLRICNSGNIPVIPGDFIRPITFIFRETQSATEIVNTEIFNATELLRPIIKTTKNIVELEPLLLNPGDSFDISILSFSVTHDFNIDSRIVGVKNLKMEKWLTRKTDYPTRRYLSYGSLMRILNIALVILIAEIIGLAFIIISSFF